VGDAQFQKKCLGKMEDVSRNEGRTVLFVSHNMGVITQLCNKGILLNKGNIEIKGPVNTVLDKYITNSGTGDDSSYIATETLVKGKTNYINKVWTANSNREKSSDFSFDENIVVKFDFTINEMTPNLLINIGFQDKLQNRVFTILKDASFFKSYEANKYTGSVLIPSSIIAPNTYSFNFQIWARDVAVYDNVENICRIKIHDNGTEFAQYEGYDYGNIIVTPTWHND
jgi:lipopolysaccharide transport system ATP-binding protein